MRVSDHRVLRAPTSPRGLTGRLLVSVALGIGAFVVLQRVVTALVMTDASTALLIAAVASVAVVLAALRAMIGPLVATHAELQVRYEEAVADALRDPLTGLGNHRAFHEDLEREVAGALRYEVPLSLVLVDLDEFKSVNDSHGHAAGDRVLRGFGELLRSGLRLADRPFRVGGDEFAVLLPHTDVEGARIVMRRLLAQALQPSVRIDNVEPISFSAGVSSLPALGRSAAELYSQADAALYAAKRGGRTEIAAFGPTLESVASDSTSASSAVADVIAHGRLGAVFQPIVSLVTGHVVGVEGLIRPLPPSPFSGPADLFEAAEASGRLATLDMACIETIVAGASALPADQFLSVNLSPPTVEAPEFSSTAILAILARHRFPPERLVIELTERQQLEDVARVRARLDACRRSGIRFAADDIGAGNAGLRLLADIRFDILKVDLTLVQRSASDGRYSAVLSSVVELATRTGALVIAEGIEEASQLEPLTALGIVTGQGYHLGRPGPLEPLPAMPAPIAIGVAAWRQSMGLSSVN